MIKRSLLLAVATLLMIGMSSASAQARPLVGLQGIPEGPQNAAALAKARSAGAKLIRLEANWSQLQPDGPGPVSPEALAALDARIDAVAARGMRVVLFMGSTPCWASIAPGKGDCSGPDRNRGEVTRFRPADVTTAVPLSAQLVARYAGKLAAFQIWNEPDQANERYWAGPDKVASYVALVKASYGPLKQANPRLPVLAGSFVGGNGAWLKAMYAAGVKGSYDGLAVQFYTATLESLRLTRQVQLAAGDRKPLWLTEWGYNSCFRRETSTTPRDQPCVSRATQARSITDVLRTISRRSWIKAAIMFELQDSPGGYQLGLFSETGAAKPALNAFRRGARSRARAQRPTIRLRVEGNRLVASGTGTLAELLTIRVSQRGQLRLRGFARADARNRWRLEIPAQLGTGPTTATVVGAWTGRGSTSRR